MNPATQRHTIADIEAFPEGTRAELIDGIIYDMSAPSLIHQDIVAELTTIFRNYIRSHKGSCRAFPAPFAVYLNQDDYNYVEPDISIICDPNKLNDKGCLGAPDFIAEVVSPASKRMDYLIKLFKYRSAGVREYWIINPENRTIQTYYFDENEDFEAYTFDDSIPVRIYEDLKICLANI